MVSYGSHSPHTVTVLLTGEFHFLVIEFLSALFMFGFKLSLSLGETFYCDVDIVNYNQESESAYFTSHNYQMGKYVSKAH